MPETFPPPPPDAHREVVRILMRRKARLSLLIATVFVGLLLGLPLINYALPTVAGQPVFGIPANWLFLAVGFYPLTWVLSWWFVVASTRMEHECADWRRLLPDHPAARGSRSGAEATPGTTPSGDQHL